ncbi:MAG: hypothetical protein NTV02_02915 [Candidatus Zambryskibacteria bacterium]|nr:hypothetical protein [Candidatus Zambryskibacteria bacterium]
MPFAPEEIENRRNRVFEAMGGWYRKDMIEGFISDKATTIKRIEGYQKQIDDLEKDFDKPGMTNSRAQDIDKLQARNRKFINALNSLLATLEETMPT